MSTGNSDDQAPRSVPYDRDRHDVSDDTTRRHDVAADRDGDGVADQLLCDWTSAHLTLSYLAL